MGRELLSDVMLASGLGEDAARAVILGPREAPRPFPSWLRPAIEIAQFARGQWRFVPQAMGPALRLGMDWAAWEQAARWLGHAIDRDVALDLQVIEDEAMKVLAP